MMVKGSRALKKGAQPSLCDQEALHEQGAVVAQDLDRSLRSVELLREVIDEVVRVEGNQQGRAAFTRRHALHERDETQLIGRHRRLRRARPPAEQIASGPGLAEAHDARLVGRRREKGIEGDGQADVRQAGAGGDAALIIQQ